MTLKLWKDIDEPWKAAFLQGWMAFTNGSIPIGAVIVDEAGKIISAGRNRTNEKSSINPKIAHAETECLQKLNVAEHPKIKQYTLYTCMEPCPMCMGTIVMSNIRKVRIASRDGYCGAAYLCNSDSYIKSKNIDVEFINGEMGTVQLVLQTYYELKQNHGAPTKITDLFKKENSTAVETATTLFTENYLEDCAKKQTTFEEIYNKIIGMR